jgi:excisionase family DNA binding protein
MEDSDRKLEREGVAGRPRSPLSAMADSNALLLTVGEAATLSGFSNRAIYRAIARGELRAVRVCSRLRIPRGWFDEWIERSVVQPERPVAVPSTGLAPAPGSFRALMRQHDERRSR